MLDASGDRTKEWRGTAEATRAEFVPRDAAMSDLAIGAINAALNGLAARQRIIAQNIANSETPNYIASKVDFESSLRSAIDSGDPWTTAVSTSASDLPPNLNGNNVTVDDETVALTDTNLRFQLMSEAINNKFHILKTSMRRDA